MVSTKRQVMRDRDRFGGFGSENSTIAQRDTSYSAPSDISSTYSHAVNASIIISDPQPAIEDIRSNGRPFTPVVEQSMLAAKPAEVAEPQKPLYTAPEPAPKTELPKRPEKVKTPFEKEDLMPSVKTRRMANQPIGELEPAVELNDAIPERAVRRQLSPRTKVMLFVYVAVALVLAIAVLATGISISTTAREAEVLSEQIAVKQAQLDEINARYAAETTPDAMRDKAISLGMTYATDSAYTAELIESSEYPAAEPHTNGFDEFCDWLSNIVN